MNIYIYLGIGYIFLIKVIGKLPERGSETEINWCLTDSKDELMDSTDVELINLMPKIPDTVYRKILIWVEYFINDWKLSLEIIYKKTKAQLNFEAILIKPKENNKTLVVLPHGKYSNCNKLLFIN